MPGNEENIDELVTRFRVDQQSAEDAANDAKRALERNRDIAIEMKALEKGDFDASLSMQKDAEDRHFQNQEIALKTYYANRLEVVRGNAEEERRIKEGLESDLRNLQEQRQQAQEKMDEDSGGMRPGGKAKEAIGGLGLSGFAGLIGIAGMAAGIKSAIDTIRESRVTAGEMAAGAGASPDNIYALSGRMRGIGRATGLGQEATARTMKEFMPIFGQEDVGASDIGNLSLSAMRMGAGAGMDPTTVARLMTQFRLLENTELPNLRKRFADVIKTAREANIPSTQFVEWLTQANNQGRMYNTTIEQNTNMVRFFSRELYRGTITMQQLSHLQQAGASTPEGFQALIASEMMSGGGEVGKILSESGATNPMSAARMLRGMLQGGLISDGKIIKPVTEEQKEIAAGRKETIEREMGNWIKKYAERMAGPEGGPGDIGANIRKLSEMLNIVSSSDTEAAGETIFGAFAKDFTISVAEQKDSSEIISDAADVMLGAAELEKAGQELLDERLSASEEVWQGIKGGFQEAVRGFDIAVANLRGRGDGRTREAVEEAKTAIETDHKYKWALKSLVGILFGMDPLATLTMAEEEIKQDEMKKRLGKFYETGDRSFLDLNINVFDNTETNPVEIEVEGPRAEEPSLPGN